MTECHPLHAPTPTTKGDDVSDPIRVNRFPSAFVISAGMAKAQLPSVLFKVIPNYQKGSYLLSIKKQSRKPKRRKRK